MRLKMSTRIQKSSWLSFFYIILSLFFITVWLWGYLKVDIFLTERKITEQESLLASQDAQLQVSQMMTGFEKLYVARQIEQSYQTIPRSEHISQVIKMLEEVKNIDTNDSETIVLSDFNVTLDSVSLKWKVSKLWLLYYTNPDRKITALLDKFTNLDFLYDIRIQNYEKKDGGFEFVLDAKVLNDGAK